MLASRGGFSPSEESIEDIVVKNAELVGEIETEEADELSNAGTNRAADSDPYQSKCVLMIESLYS